MYHDEESGVRIKRLWSFRDKKTGKRHYADIASLSPESRRRLIQQYAQFLEQLRSVRAAMADYFAGQQFFEFYAGKPDVETTHAVLGRHRAKTQPKLEPIRPANV